MITQQRQVIFAKAPRGAISADCFELVDAPLPGTPTGGLLTRNIYLSCDPYMRGRMTLARVQTGSFELGKVIPARVVAQVVASDTQLFAPGDYVWGFLGWEEYSAVTKAAHLRRIDSELGPLSNAISVLGMPGLTAEVGMLELGMPQPGETVFVSAASGAVGSIAGQLAKLAGARVIGSAGTDTKVAHLLNKLGFDAAFNYKSVPIGAALDTFCVDGIDVYFDNVGGATLDAVLTRINPFARIPVCGQISGYDSDPQGVKGIGAIVAKRATLSGFIVSDHMHKFDAFLSRMARRLHEGELSYFEDIIDGIENTPDAFVGMMRGNNIGKRLVRVTADEQ
jgi:NADPH-dependent curcumin reductase CurA